MEFEIGKKFDGTRLDKFIRRKYKNQKLGFLYKSLRKGDIKVNGKKSYPSYRLQEDDTVFFHKKPKKKKKFIDLSKKEEVRVKNSIVYENDEIILYHKSSSMVVHKGSGHDYGVLEMLKSYYKNKEIHLINRLDKDTEGLMVVAKNLIKTRKLNEIFKKRNVNKNYYSVVKGNPKENEFVIEKNIKKAVSGVEISKEGKFAKTKCKVLKSNEKYSLLDIELITGRKHQIRAHLSHTGLPIVGDYKYGIQKGNQMFLLAYYINIPEESIEYKLDLIESYKKFFL